MNNKFTKGAENALKNARETAQLLGHTHIGSEHLLLGIASTAASVGARLLESVHAEKDALLSKTKEICGFGAKSNVSPDDLTASARKIITDAGKRADSLGFAQIGTEHILYALLCDDSSTACAVLYECNISPKALKKEIQSFFGSVSELKDQPKEEKKRERCKKTSVLLEFGKDLTAEASKPNADKVIGRDKEINRVIRTLSRKTKNNPILIGEPGVGKTAIAEGLALAICEKRVPDSLLNKQIISLDLSSMIAGAKYRGEFEDRLKNVINSAKQDKDVILFIDEIHTIIGAGSAEGALDAANILKPSLARGEIRVIGATTTDEYIRHIEKDAALERRFQPIKVGEPTVEECCEILFGIRDALEKHHGIKISDGAIKEAVKLSVQYIPEKFLPDKAIDIIDEAASALKLAASKTPKEIKETEKRLEKIRKEKNKALLSADTENAESLRRDEIVLSKALLDLKIDFERSKRENKPILTENEVLLSLSEQTGIDLSEISANENDALSSLPEILKEKIFGQDEAINAVCSTVLKSKIGIRDLKKPVGSFMFCGPSGVGKTALAKALSEQPMFRGGLIKLDMSEYSEPHSISKLIGTPPGYVGYEENGKLTDKVRNAPNSVILFDEIEKAHRDVFNLLLQILEDGVLTDNRSKTAYFSNCLIILSTNAGSTTNSIGFNDGTTQKMSYSLSSVFSPELLDRIDEIVQFNCLSQEAKCKIAKRALDNIKEKLSDIGYSFEFSCSLYEKLTKQENSKGARTILRNVKRFVEEPISLAIIRGEIKKSEIYDLDIINGKTEIKAVTLCI